MKDAIRRSSVVISGNQRLLMEDAIRWSSEVIKSQSVVISGHQRHSHLWDRSDRNQRSSSRNQWSSVVISAILTCGIARIARRHWRRGTLAASHPSSLINPSPRGSRREIAARSVDLPDEACNQWLMRHRGAGARSQRGASTYLPSEAISGHQFAIRCNQWSPELIKSQSELIKSQSEFIKSQSDSPAPERPTMATWSPAPIEIVSRCMVGRPCGEYDS